MTTNIVNAREPGTRRGSNYLYNDSMKGQESRLQRARVEIQDPNTIFTRTIHEHEDSNPVQMKRVVIFGIVCLIVITPFLL